jgi:hypothetical protein
MDAYRASPQEPRFICIVCYENLAPTSQTCPRDGVPMQPLDDAAVQSELRTRAAAKKKQINGRRTSILFAVSFLIGFGLNGLLLWKGVYDFHNSKVANRSSGAAYFFLLILPLLMSCVVLALLEKGAKLARVDLFSERVTIDPSKASTPDLLFFLGLDKR